MLNVGCNMPSLIYYFHLYVLSDDQVFQCAVCGHHRISPASHTIWRQRSQTSGFSVPVWSACPWGKISQPCMFFTSTNRCIFVHLPLYVQDMNRYHQYDTSKCTCRDQLAVRRDIFHGFSKNNKYQFACLYPCQLRLVLL